MSRPTPGLANAYPKIGPVVITEIMPSPQDPDAPADASDFEFVEIYNASASDVDMTEWRLRKGIGYDFADATILASGATAVVVTFDTADVAKLTPAALSRKLKQLEAKMHEHAKKLEFEEAASLRDQLVEIKQLAFVT